MQRDTLEKHARSIIVAPDNQENQEPELNIETHLRTKYRMFTC